MKTALFALALCAFLGFGQNFALAAEGDKAPAGSSSFARMDKDGNGKATAEEFHAAFPDMSEEAFRMIDQNSDGAISQEEWANFHASHGKQGNASMGMGMGMPPRERAGMPMMMPPSGGSASGCPALTPPAKDGKASGCPAMPMVMPPKDGDKASSGCPALEKPAK